MRKSGNNPGGSKSDGGPSTEGGSDKFGRSEEVTDQCVGGERFKVEEGVCLVFRVVFEEKVYELSVE